MVGLYLMIVLLKVLILKGCVMVVCEVCLL